MWQEHKQRQLWNVFNKAQPKDSSGFFLSEIVSMYTTCKTQRDPKLQTQKKIHFAAAAFEETLGESICIVTELIESISVFSKTL